MYPCFLLCHQRAHLASCSRHQRAHLASCTGHQVSLLDSCSHHQEHAPKSSVKMLIVKGLRFVTDLSQNDRDVTHHPHSLKTFKDPSESFFSRYVLFTVKVELQFLATWRRSLFTSTNTILIEINTARHWNVTLTRSFHYCLRRAHAARSLILFSRSTTFQCFISEKLGQTWKDRIGEIHHT